jgi:hypothetical protein
MVEDLIPRRNDVLMARGGRCRPAARRVLDSLTLESPRLKCSLRVLVLHLRNGGSRTVYTKLVLRLPQSSRAHKEPSKHQDRLGAVKLQE